MKNRWLSQLGTLCFGALLLAACGGSSATGGSAGSTGSAGSGGMSSGGMSSGGAGADTACKVDSDCVACAYPTAPEKPTDCYCASCAGTALAKTACTSNQAAWQAVCSGTPRPCPAIACIRPPVPVCSNGMCAASTGGAPAN